MKKASHNKISPLILLIAICLSALSGCTFAKQCVSALRSTDNFTPYQNDQRVLFEPGAEDYAKKIASFLPLAIQEIKEK